MKEIIKYIEDLEEAMDLDISMSDPYYQGFTDACESIKNRCKEHMIIKNEH